MGRNWLDLTTQQCVRATGRRVDLSRGPWLQWPVGGTGTIAASCGRTTSKTA